MRLGSRDDDRRWLRGLCERARQWVEANGGLIQRDNEGRPTGNPIATNAYVDLIFAFGLARLGDKAASADLVGRAQALLQGGGDAVHLFLLDAYRYRIGQALECQPHEGLLTPRLLDRLPQMYFADCYKVDRLRQHSRILEPDQLVDPYRKWSPRVSERTLRISGLCDLSDREGLIACIRQLLESVRAPGAPVSDREFILCAVLESVRRTDREFAREVLNQSLGEYDAFERRDEGSLAWQVAIVQNAVAVAARFGETEHGRGLATRFARLIEAQPQALVLPILAAAAGWLGSGLRRLGLREERAQLLERVVSSALGTRSLRDLDIREVEANPAILEAVLNVAGEWFADKGEGAADEMLTAAAPVLFAGRFHSKHKQCLACAYARAAGRAPEATARPRLEELFDRLRGFNDTYSTQGLFSVSQLELVETVILGVTTELEPSEPASILSSQRDPG